MSTVVLGNHAIQAILPMTVSALETEDMLVYKFAIF